jgi:hypothetical protein
MEWKHYRIHAHDEVPRVGSGHRTVLAQVGRKWVRVKSRVDPAAWSQKIKVLTWKTIVKEEV